MKQSGKKHKIPRTRKNDILLITGLAIAAAAGFIWYGHGYGQPGREVIISVDGKQYARLSLQEEREVCIGKTNILTVSQGKVWMKQADCPDQICVNHIPIFRAGETIVCLPNRVVAEITEGTAGSGIKKSAGEESPDSMAY